MAEFLLVHPGFAGGWVWRRTAEALVAQGHRVLAPTLTGLGERAHLARPETGLDTHVDDLAAVLDCEEAGPVVLVASSYGAMPAQGLAARRPAAVERIVWIDTLVPRAGESWFDLMGPAIAGALGQVAREAGEGWRIPRRDVAPPRWVAQPLKTVTDKARGDLDPGLPCTYLWSRARPDGWFMGLGAVIDAFAAGVPARGWAMRELPTDHLPMLGAPDLLASALTE